MPQTENLSHYCAEPYAVANISLEAIRKNTREFVTQNPNREVLAVVKADGFGHGMIPVVETVLEAGATWLGVATAQEALDIREAGIEAPVLAWLPFGPFSSDADLKMLIDYDIDISVIDPQELYRLAKVATVQKPARVHLKIDTGIHRSGCDQNNWQTLCQSAVEVESTGRLRVVGIWSHLSHGRQEDGGQHSVLQLNRLKAARDTAEELGLHPEFLHLNNSAGAIRSLNDGTNLVRIGASIYGIYNEDVDVQYAMEVKTKIAALHTLAIGEGVGYDHIWVAERESRVALAPIGFADGVPRDIEGAEFFVNGTRVPVVGRVSMDQTVLDVTDIDVAIGDDAIMFGAGSNGEPTPDDWAEWANTNQHDILCGIGKRVHRVYVN